MQKKLRTGPRTLFMLALCKLYSFFKKLFNVTSSWGTECILTCKHIHNNTQKDSTTVYLWTNIFFLVWAVWVCVLLSCCQGPNFSNFSNIHHLFWDAGKIDEHTSGTVALPFPHIGDIQLQVCVCSHVYKGTQRWRGEFWFLFIH